MMRLLVVAFFGAILIAVSSQSFAAAAVVHPHHAAASTQRADPRSSARADSTCALVAEGDIAPLACAHGIANVSQALFGLLTDASSCASTISPADNCTIDIAEYVAQACAGRCQCNIRCSCGYGTPCRCYVNGAMFPFPGWPCPNIPKKMGVRISCMSSDAVVEKKNMRAEEDQRVRNPDVFLEKEEEELVNGISPLVLRDAAAVILAHAPSVTFSYPGISRFLNAYALASPSSPKLVASDAAQRAGASSASSQVPPAPINLLTEFLDSPLGMDQLQPHFTWVIAAPSGTKEADRRLPEEFQSAAQVVVRDALTAEVVWDSGLVNTTTAMLVPSQPLAFMSDRRYLWSVRVWNQGSGQVASPFSNPAVFTTGLLLPSDWAASWVGQKHMIRRDFSVPAELAGQIGRVSVFVSTCQYYKLYLDGVLVTPEAVLDVGWTNFPTNRTYATWEIPPGSLQPGCHAIGLMVGQGFCGQYSAILQLQAHSIKDDSVIFRVLTDSGWSGIVGPVVSDSTYFGETYDARLEQPGWSTAGFTPPVANTTELWEQLQVEAGAPYHLNSQLMQPIRRIDLIPPQSVHEPAPGVYVFDFGQEFTGFLQVSIPAHTTPGTNVTLRHAEALQHPPFGPFDGSLFMGNLFWANPVDFFFTGDANASLSAQFYEPHFTYHGFRYADLTANPPLPQPPTVDDVRGVNIRSSVPVAATILLENPLIQRISNNSWWTESAALMSIPAGCAARGERNGWVGDAAFASESEMFDFDTAAFFSRYLDQVENSQCADGSIGNGIPADTAWQQCGGESDPSWGTVFNTITFNLWKYYGAVGHIRAHYPALQHYMHYTTSRYNSSGLQTLFSFWGDWNPAYPRPRINTDPAAPFIRTLSHITAATTFVHDHMHMVDIAEAIGETADAAYYRQRVAALKQEFHTVFFDPAKQMYGDGTLTAQAVALWLDVVPPALLPSVVANLVAEIESTFDNHAVGIGFIGVRYLFEALAKVNRTDVAVRLLQQTTYPSFGYEITNQYEPATSLWECFDGDTMHQWVDESSRDHHYEASINTFVRKYLVGLDMPEGQVSAFSTVKVRPEAALLNSDLAATLPAASVQLQTHHGAVQVSWRVNPSAIPPMPGPPAVAPPASPCGVQPQFPIPAGGLCSGQTFINLTCPAGQTVVNVSYAKIGMPKGWLSGAFDQRDGGWFCFGPQPPAAGDCEKDISADVLRMCRGLNNCVIPASKSAYGSDPCSGRSGAGPGYQVAARVVCSGGNDDQRNAAREGKRASNLASDAETLDVNSKWKANLLDRSSAATIMQLNVTIPPGSRGEVHVPVYNQPSSVTITESGTVVWSQGSFVAGQTGVLSAQTDSRFVTFATAAGAYLFSVAL